MTMEPTGFTTQPTWRWSGGAGKPRDGATRTPRQRVPGAFEEGEEATTKPPRHSNQAPPRTRPASARMRTWGPRTCRICLEVVQPTFHPPEPSLPGMPSSPRVTYDSEDPASGRLIRPCKCKGSSRYVHEACLQTWRHADPGYGRRNYWECPTCGFRYRLERMAWGRAISSTATQILLTFSIFFLAIFLLGFVADPIINTYLDPLGTWTSLWPPGRGIRFEPLLADDDEPTWAEHFLKGLASLGLLGFVKVLFALSPWQYWNLRSSGILGGRGRAGSGRDRLANLSWFVIVIGIATFLWVSGTISSRSGHELTTPGRIQGRSRMEPACTREGVGKGHGCGAGGR
jgi:hypothetical protein